MLSTWLPRFLVPFAIALAFALFRRMAPPRARMAEHRYDESQFPEPLPSGVIGGAMWSAGIALAMLFFVLRGANHLWASLEGPSLLTQYAPQVFWLLAWSCCSVDPMASHSLVSAESGPLARG